MKFTPDEIDLIDTALEHAIEDVEQYFRNGTPEEDMSPEDYEKYKRMPDRWAELRQRILSETGYQ